MNCPCFEPLVFGHTSMRCAMTIPPVMSHYAGGHFPCSYCADLFRIRDEERREAQRRAAA